MLLKKNTCLLYLVFTITAALYSSAQAATLTVARGSKDPVATNESPAGLGVEMLQFTMTASGGVVNVTNIEVDGTANDTFNDRTGNPTLRDITNNGIKLVEDINGDGFYESSEDTLIATTSRNPDGSAASFSPINLTIPSGTTRTFLILYDFNGSAANGETAQCQIVDAASIDSDATTEVVPNIVSNFKTFRTGATNAGTLYAQIGGSNPGNTSEPKANDAEDLAMIQFVLAASTREDITVNSITLTATGTADDSIDIASAKLYRDENNNGAVDGGGTPIGSTAYFSADNGTITFGSLNETITAGSVNWYVVGYSLNGSATNGETLALKINANSDISATGVTTSSAITAIGSAPYTGGIKTISSTGTLAISAGSSNPVNKNEASNATNVEVMQFNLEAGTVEDVKVTSIKFTASGTGDDLADITGTGVRLYQDSNNNGIWDSASDTQIGSAGAYSANNGTVTFSGLTEVISKGSNENWLVVYDFNGNASDTETFSLQIANNSDISAEGITSSNAITPSGAALSGCTITISSGTGTLTLLEGANNPGESNEDNNADNIVMLQFSARASSVEDIDITEFVFSSSGSGSEKFDCESPAVYLYQDVDGSGTLNAGDIQVGNGEDWSNDNGTVTFTNTVRVTAGTTKNFIVLMSLDGSASNGEDFQVKIAQQSDITATGVTSGNPVVATGPTISGNIKTISTTGTLTIAAGENNPPAQNISNSAQDIAILQLYFTASTAEDMVISSITLSGSGTGHDKNDISNVELYIDVNNNGVYDSGTDSKLGSSTTFSADNSNITFSGFNRSITANSTENWIVVYDLNSTASNNETFKISLDSNANITAIGSISGAGTKTGAPVSSNFMSITNVGKLTVTAGSNNPAAGNEAAGATDLEMLQLNLAANDTENVEVTSITFTAVGTADDRNTTAGGDLADSGASLYLDVNNNGIYDSGTDTQLGSSGNLSADNGTITFSGFTRTINASASENWLLVYDLAGSATDGETFQAKLAANTDITATGVDSTQTVTRIGAPITGSVKTIQQLGSLTLAIGSNNPGSTNQANNATGVPAFQISLTASSAENVTVNSIQFTASGTGDDVGAGALVNLNGLDLYLDANGDGLIDGGDSQLTQIDGFNADNGTASFTGLNQTVTASGTLNFLLVYDFNGTAANGETFISRIANNTDITATGVTSGQSISTSGAPIQSNTITMSSTGSVTVAAGPQNSTSPLGATTEQDNATNVEMLQISITPNATEAANINSITFSITGTGHDTEDITAGSVKLYFDGGTTAGTWDAGDTLLGSGGSWSADNGSITFSGSPLRNIAASATEKWLLVMNLNGSAVNGETYKASLTSNTNIDAIGATSVSGMAVSGAPINGGTKTIEATGTLALSAGDNNPAASNELSAAQDVEAVQIKLTAGPNEDVKVTQLVVSAPDQGTNDGDDNTDISDVSLYLDVNSNGVFDSGTDTAISTGKTYSADNGTVTFNSLTEVISADSSEEWLVVYDFGAGATNTEKYQAQVTTANITAVGNSTANAVTATGSTVSGGVKTITGEGTLTCEIGSNTPAASNEASDADGVAVLQIKLTADAVENITVSSIKFTDAGSNSHNMATELDTARLYNDTNGNGILDGDPQIGSTGTLSGTGITFSGISEVIDLGTSENWLLVLDLSSSATNPDTFIATVNAAGDIDVSGSTPNAVSGSFAVSGNTITISSTPNVTVALGAETPAAGNMANDESNVTAVQISMAASSAADVTVNSIVFTASGTMDDLNDITASSVELYYDNGTTNGVLDGSDTLIKSSGSFSADNGTVTFSSLNRTITASSTQKWLVVFDCSGSASGNETIALKVNASGDVTLSSGTVSGSFPVQGNTMTVSDVGTLSVSAGDAPPAAADVANDVADKETLQIKLTASGAEKIDISSITFTASGTIDDASDVTASSVKLYLDANSNGIYDSGVDALIGSGGSFSADNGTITFSGLTETINASATEQWLLIQTLSGSASNAETFKISINAAASISATGQTSAQSITPTGSFPINGNTMTVSNVGSLTIAAGDNNPVAATISNAASDLEMLQLKLSASDTEDIDITAITFTALGTADDSTSPTGDITNNTVRLYKDVNNNGAYDSGTDSAIGSAGNYSADNGTITFSGLTETITASTTQNWLLVYDLAGNASAGETFIAKITDNSNITAAGVDSSTAITPSGAPVTGNTMTVSANAILTASTGDNNPGNTNEFNNATDVVMIQVKLNASSSGSDINISSITFTATGTADDRNSSAGGDLSDSSVRLFNDVNNNGTYESGTDTAIGSGGNYNANNGTITFSGLSETISENTTENWIVIMSLAGSSAEGETFICKLNDPTTDISATESGSAPGLTITGSTITGGTKTSTTVTDVTWDGSDSGLWSSAANWDNNIIPGNSIDVTIPDASGTPNDPTVDIDGHAKTLTMNTGSILNVGTGNTLTIYNTSTLSGSFTMNAGSYLKVESGQTLTADASSSFTVNDGCTISNNGSGTFNMNLAGDVNLAGTTGSHININNCYLTFSGSGGSAAADYVYMDGIADAGTYLTITGSDWSAKILEGWGFKEITGGSAEVTVNMNNAAVSATMTKYDTGSGYIGGEATDLDTAGTINWSTTAAMIMEFNGVPFSKKDGILLHWKTATEEFNQGFNIYRCEIKNIDRKLPEFRLRKPGKKWQKINSELLVGKGDSTDVEEYAIVDKTVKPGKNYVYMLVDVDVGNNPSVRTSPIRVSLEKPGSKNLVKNMAVTAPNKWKKRATTYNILSPEADNTWRWTAAVILLAAALVIALQKKHRRKAIVPATMALIVLSTIAILTESKRKNIKIDVRYEPVIQKQPIMPGIKFRKLTFSEEKMQINVMTDNASTPMAIVNLPADANLKEFANAIEQSYDNTGALAYKAEKNFSNYNKNGRRIRLFPAITHKKSKISKNSAPKLLAIAEKINMPKAEEVIEQQEEEEARIPRVILAPPLKPSDDNKKEKSIVIRIKNIRNIANIQKEKDIKHKPVDPTPPKPNKPDPPKPHKPDPLRYKYLPPTSKYFVEPTLTKTMRITTDKEGLHLLTVNQLQMAGFDFSKKFSLTNNGKEVKFWRIVPSQPSEASMMTNDHCDIVFYAEPHKDRYTANNVYFLRQYQVGLIETSESRNKIADLDSEIKYANYTPVYKTISIEPISESSNEPVTGTPLASPHFAKDSIAEENIWYRQNLTNGKADEPRWFYLWPKAVSGAPFDLGIECDKVVTSEKGSVTAVLRSWAATSPASHIRISVNGTPVSDFEWDGARTVELTAEIPENVLVEGTNTVNFFSFQDTPAGAGERDLIDWVKINYRRELVAKDGQLQFTADSNSSGTVTTSGFDSEDILGISISASGSQSFIDNINITPDGAGYKATFKTTTGSKYLVSTIDGMHNPALIEAAVEPVDMRTLSADYIIVCADALKNVAYHYAWYHNQQGLDTKVFTLTEALDAANFGIYSPQAISNLVEEAGASYLLLLGDMTYDYFSRNNTEADFAVPGWFISTQGFESVSDYAFAYARNSGGNPLVSVGRIPARTEEQAFAVLEKIRARVGMAQQPTELVVAAESTSEQFRRIAENAAAQSSGTVVKAYEADLGVSEAHAALRRAWNNGSNHIFFAGHGSKHIWSNNSLLTTQLVPGLVERDVLPLVIQLNCQSNAAYFTHDATGYSCIGEALIMTPKKGAAAVIGSTGTAAPESQEKLGVRTLYYLNNGTHRIGDAFRKAMTDVLNDKPDPQVLNSFILLGDPASE